ncbi:MAG: phosphoribosylglycinamide formyltransferase [Acetanaerobacterium sp.]
MVNIAVLVSGGGTNLQALIDAQQNGQNPYGRLALVVSSKADAFALERAANHGIKTAVVARREYKNARDFDAALLRVLQEHDISIVVLAGFLCILGEGLLDAYRDRIVNVHPSLIPSFCGDGFYGLKVHEAALARGVKVTGATVHLVNEITDGGRILLQKAVDVLEGDTPEVLQQRVMEQAEWVLLPEAVDMLCRELEAAP